MSTLKNYLSLIKFSHTIFAMPFAMIGFFIGCVNSGLISNDRYISRVPGLHSGGFPGYKVGNSVPQNFVELILRFVLVILCMIFARSAAMAFNRWLDANFDARNPRTAIREIPSGIISSNNALFFVVISSLAFVITTFFINTLCFALSPVALL